MLRYIDSNLKLKVLKLVVMLMKPCVPIEVLLVVHPTRLSLSYLRE